MKKIRYSFFLLFISLTVFLTGCDSSISSIIKVESDVDLEVDVNIDGTVDLTIDILVEKPKLDILNKTEETLAAISDGLESQSFLVAEIEEGEKIGLRAERHIDTSSGAYAAPLDLENIDSLIGREDLVVITNYTVNENFSIKDTLVEYGVIDESPFIESILRQSDMTFTLKLPIRPSEHNAPVERDGGKTLVWNIDPIEDNWILLKVTVPNIKGIAIFGGAVVIALVLFIVLFKRIIGLFFMNRGNKNKK